ncbi:MAG: ACT domain-containing protein [Anaerolineae bacterium]|jgi:hypothetical protein
MELIVSPEVLGICRLKPDAGVPRWALRSPFFSVTRTQDELSVVCAESLIPEDVACEGGWRCFQVHGPLDFSLTGILASLAAPLAEAGVSIFALSTYNTDRILVKEAQIGRARNVLTQQGHHIIEQSDCYDCYGPNRGS